MNLTIITVSKYFDNNLIETLKSVQNQSVEPHEHIVIVSKIQGTSIEFLLSNFSKNYRIFIFNKDSSIYNGMNLGIQKAFGNYLYFLNSGDIFLNNNTLSNIYSCENLYPNKILIFQTLQVYNNLSFLRNPKKSLNRLFISPAHQGFIVPFYSERYDLFLFNELNHISADTEWMKGLLTQYQYKIIELVICKFYLGGISNFPTLKTIKLKRNSLKFISEILKYFFRLIFGTKFYYIVISYLNGYERVYR
ncbi:hypothetical protein V7S74_05380 [Aquirufa sp. 2-AUSEE-184A6]|uniref:Glycosyltransferase n=1 Tax=Aquirufa novilacunae TaxID=3139305 RepID=A0ABW8SUZ5_9BACT